VVAPLAAYLGVQRPTRRDAAWAVALAALAIWLLLGPADEFTQLERAWIVLLTGSLVIVLVVGRTRGFVATTLTAVFGAGAAAAVLMGLTGLSAGKLAGLAQQHYFVQARLMLDLLAPVGSPTREVVYQSIQAGVRFVGGFLPGLVLLQTLAATALAWALYHRIAREPRSEPLAPLATFRFNDHLIWGVALSLLVVVLPRLGWARALGGNLLLFFGGLYLIRGVAVLAAVAAAIGFTGAVATVAVVLGAALLWWLLAPAALVVGLTDTLVDWRHRLARSVPKR
jgi:hypothetical protein